MRKTFVVGRLTGTSTHIRLLDDRAGSTSPRPQLELDLGAPAWRIAPKAPQTIH